MSARDDPPAAHHEHGRTTTRGRGNWVRSRTGVALLGFLAVAGFFLLTEHTAHVFGVLPYLLLFACPFLHLFGHGGHGGHGGSDGTRG